MATPGREPSAPLALLPPVGALDDVLRNVQTVIDWSIAEGSPTGYFAAMYKRTTLAIAAAISRGDFGDGPRMERFVLVFAQRYFDALNAYFHPKPYEAPSHVWQVAFDGNEQEQPIILAQLLTAMAAHIDYDLGIAAATVGGDELELLHKDFDIVNGVLGSQVPGVLDAVSQCSPGVAAIRHVIPDRVEFGLIAQTLKAFRDAAWTFAQLVALQPDLRPGACAHRDVQSAELGTCCLYPGGDIQRIVDAIAAQESRDVAENIRTLDKMAQRPAALMRALV